MEKLTYQEYESREGFRQSSFKHLARSPGHYQEAQKNPTKSDALTFGSAFHTFVLEPELFQGQFAVLPLYDGRTAEGKKIKAAFEAENKGKELLTSKEMETIRAMAASINRHESARKIIELSKEREQSIFWTDPETGVKCKARLDMICRPLNVCFDLKTTEDASLREFSRSIVKWGYHYQGAHTLNGCAANGEGIEAFGFIAVEKTPPHGVGVYRIEDQSLITAGLEIQALLRLYKACVESGNWPIYPDKIQEISIPEWAIKYEE